MRSAVHFALGAVACAMVLSPAFATPPEPVEVRVLRAFPDELIVEREVVREIVRERCDGDVALKQINELLRSRGITGDAGTDNDADGSADVSQAASAVSGDAILGQLTEIIAACSTVNANLTNTVIDSEARTGDASADNDVGLDRPPLSGPRTTTSTATRTAGARR